MDSNISDLIGGVLSNPEMLNKVMTLMPIVTQMMGSNNNGQTISTAAVQPDQNQVKQPTQSITSIQSTENLMANANVAAALKNLIEALNSASSTPVVPSSSMNDETPHNDSVMTMASALSDTNNTNNTNAVNANMNKINDIVNLLGSSAKQNNVNENINTATNSDAQNQQNPNNNSTNSNPNNIEKTLDTLKNISSATSPDSDNKTKLLLALKPFLKDDRKTKIDTAIKYMSAAKILNMFGKNGFV